MTRGVVSTTKQVIMHMATLYKDKYRVESTRLREWDYSSSGYYFVTICTNNMECVLSRITYGKVVLTGIGNIAKRLWLEVPEHFKNVELDEFIIMPNHMHGIVIINNVETCHGMSLQKKFKCKQIFKTYLGFIGYDYQSIQILSGAYLPKKWIQ